MAVNVHLPQLIFVAGVLQFSVLIASALVPVRLNWRKEFEKLSPLHRQMYWVYGGYVVLAIVALASISLLNADEIARGGGLARGFSLFAAAFWTIRLSLQPVLRVKEHLSTWWLTLGYHTLTLLFLYFAVVFAWSALHA